MLNSQKKYYIENDAYADDIDNLDVEIPFLEYWEAIAVDDDLNAIRVTIAYKSGACILGIDDAAKITEVTPDCSMFGY